jgi:hypothetical protein
MGTGNGTRIRDALRMNLNRARRRRRLGADIRIVMCASQGFEETWNASRAAACLSGARDFY